ncbi:MAG: prephenate dehydrogenase/arogenate dehydrogenase family protein [Chloroflexi bacterium]|nr:prephenate dehydrogenase/arogenate dehydrogenase family protein [Chloroflexota bacterium]
MANITIIGMGLIGTSLGMALKRSSKAQKLRILGHDREPTATRKAHQMGAIDSNEWNIIKAVREADLVIIATPVVTIKEVMEQIGPHLPEDCVVTDTGSTKQQVLRWAEEILPSTVSFVGGHPMAGKSDSGPAAADADLFKGVPYCILPLPSAEAWAVQAVVGIAESVGAEPYFVDPLEHDSIVAAVSHIPIALSSALMACTSKSPSWFEMARLASGGYRDSTRLASGDPEMNRDIFTTNSKEISVWIDRIIAELLEMRRQLNEGDEEGLTRLFVNVYEEREKWTAGLAKPQTGPNVEVPSTADQMGSLLFGELLAQKSKRLMKQYEQTTKERRDGKNLFGGKSGKN